MLKEMNEGSCGLWH